MPWSPAGQFTRYYGAAGWTDDRNSGINILASKHDTHDEDLAEGINACMTRDGTAKPSADFNPSADDSLSLGSTLLQWKYIFLKGIGRLPDAFGNVLGYGKTAAETSAGATIVTWSFPPAHPYRYGTNTVPGTTDMTAFINMAANVARAANIAVRLPGQTMLVSASLNFHDVYVIGEGAQNAVTIQANASQFDVVTSNAGTVLEHFRIDGGGVGTAGLTGDILSFIAVAPAFPYIDQLSHMVLTNAKRDLLHIERGGYVSLWACRLLGAGRRALHDVGLDLGANATTTLRTGGSCQFGGTPNDASIYIENSAAINLNGDIIESTSGAAIKIRGDNRAFSAINVYAENTGTKFIDWVGSSGIGAAVLGCFGGNTSIDYNANWENQFLPAKGNSNLSMPAAFRDANNSVELLSDEVIRDVADADDFTPTTATGALPMAITLTTGDWTVWAVLQTRINTGSPTLVTAAMVITDSATPSSVSGLNDSTNNSFIVASDMQRSVPLANCRLRAEDDFIVTSTAVTLTLRCLLDFTGASAKIAVKAKLMAKRKI